MNGKQRDGTQKYKCNLCGKNFQYAYKYEACKPSTKKKIEQEISMGHGIRETSRRLKVSTHSVIKTTRRKVLSPVNFKYMHEANRLFESNGQRISVILDEMWSFVGSKRQQCWVLYAIDQKTGIVLAYVIGRRTDENCKKLIDLLRGFPIAEYYTDDWKCYRNHIPK